MTLTDDISRRFSRSPINIVALTLKSTVLPTEGNGAPSLNNKDMVASLTTSDGDVAVSVPLVGQPLQSVAGSGIGSYVGAKVGGSQVEVGDGVKTKDCYFSGDLGVTARLQQDIQPGDVLHWNGTIAGYELSTDMKISFMYYEFTEESDDPTPDTTFYFSPKDGRPLNLRLGIDIRPYLLSSKGRPARISPDMNLTERARFTITLHEDENAPALPADRFLITSGGGFFRRLIAAQPDYIGSNVEILRGFDEPGFGLSDFVRIFKGRLEDIDLQQTGNASLICKDDLALNDIEIPAQASDTNVLQGDITTASTNIPVLQANEFTDPELLPSRDYVPITIRIGTEDIIIRRRTLATNDLVVQDQNIDKSEDHSVGPWTIIGTASVVADTDIGPFGGLSRADTILLPSVADAIEQSSGRKYVAAANWTYAVWLRATNASTVGTVTIRVEATGGVFQNTNRVTLTTSWQRFDVVTLDGSLSPAVPVVRIIRDSGDVAEVKAFGSALYEGSLRGQYVYTDGNDGELAGRGAFSTTAAAHTAGDGVIEVGVYRQQNEDQGVHPVMVMRDLVNRGGIGPVDVDQSTFDREQDFIPSSQLKRASLNAVIEPEKLSQHIFEVRQQGQLDLWVSETGLVQTRLNFRVNLPGVPIFNFSDEINILDRSAMVKGNAESRVTKQIVYYDQFSGTAGKDREDYDKVQIAVDLNLEQISGPKTKFMLARWIFREQDAVAVAGRILSRFRRGAKIYKFQLDLKDVPDFNVGDLMSVNTTDFLTGSGVNAIRDVNKLWQVVFREHKEKEGLVAVEALEANGLKFAIISPSGWPDFPVATDTERQYGFIGDSNNLVNVGTEDGYYIL